MRRRSAPDDVELAKIFDRLKAATDKQEVMRGLPPAEFRQWVERARPHFEPLRDALEERKRTAYGLTLVTYWDWIYWRELEPWWLPPLEGPLVWQGPLFRDLAGRLGLLPQLEKFSAAMRALGARDTNTPRKRGR